MHGVYFLFECNIFRVEFFSANISKRFLNQFGVGANNVDRSSNHSQTSSLLLPFLFKGFLLKQATKKVNLKFTFNSKNLCFMRSKQDTMLYVSFIALCEHVLTLQSVQV